MNLTYLKQVGFHPAGAWIGVSVLPPRSAEEERKYQEDQKKKSRIYERPNNPQIEEAAKGILTVFLALIMLVIECRYLPCSHSRELRDWLP
jgi:hypothetical protein